MPVGEVYDLLTACVSPRPIGFISTVSSLGQPNLAPFSFFTVGGANPPSIVFSAVVNIDGSMKETFKNVAETGEFVVNTVHREMMDGVSRAAIRASADTPKWERSGFGQLPSLQVRPPRVAESLVQLECKVFQVIEHGSGAGSARYVIGEVLVAHVSPDLLRQGKVSGDLVHSIARMGGKSYVDTASLELFEPEGP
jgi:flavin reductase (DIM6/NTAB) family NADH-FMN oxidoreductase RutF